MPTNQQVHDADALNGINIKGLGVNGYTILRKDSECPIKTKKHINKI